MLRFWAGDCYAIHRRDHPSEHHRPGYIQARKPQRSCGLPLGLWAAELLSCGARGAAVEVSRAGDTLARVEVRLGSLGVPLPSVPLEQS